MNIQQRLAARRRERDRAVERKGRKKLRRFIRAIERQSDTLPTLWDLMQERRLAKEGL